MLGAGDGVRQPNKNVDDHKRDEKRRAVGVRGQSGPVAAAEDAQRGSIENESTVGKPDS
jgi:hypothetical protein